MVETEPMPVEVLIGLVQLVRKGGGWPTKGALVLLVGAQVGGGWLTSEDAAERSGRAPGTCRRLLGQLENERVILRDPGVAGGAGGGVRYWCEVNPDWAAWRVAWRVPRRVVAQRVVLLADEARKSALERFTARSFDARYPQISARLWARESVRREAAEAALARVSWTRDNGPSGGAYRAKSGGKPRSGGGVSRDHARALSAPAPQEVGASLGVDDASTPVRGPAPPKKEQAISVQHSHLLAAKRAICGRSAPGQGTARPVIFPRSQLEQRVTELVAAHGLEAILAGVDTIDGATFAPPMFVDLLAELLSTGALPAADRAALDQPAPPAHPALLRERRRQVEQRIATYEAEGYEAPAELQAERAELDEALSAYDDNMGDQEATA